MQLWHLTPDAGRQPHRVTPGVLVHLRIGTWPIEADQEILVEYHVTPAGGGTRSGSIRARWVQNIGENSYWTATLGPFADSERVTYRVVGTPRSKTAVTDRTSFTVGPAIHLALLWHHHQPLYRDLLAPPAGAYRFPWARLHALRDYFAMASLVAQHPDVHLTINFSPALLWQLEDYLRGGSDRALELTRTPTSRLTGAERREILETFFDAHWHHQIYPHPRYRALLEQRVQQRRFSGRELTDLKMWFNLAWFAEPFRAGVVSLPDGTEASVQRFVVQGAGFTQRDVNAMLVEQEKVIRNVVPLHRQLQERGQIEVSVTPFFHPIAPLLMDTDLAVPDRPGTTLPPRFAHPEDVEGQIAAAVDFYRERFGRPPRGMWPAEGAVAEPLIPLFVHHGIRWIATDEGVLARSGRYGYRVDDPSVLCQPYQALAAEHERGLSVYFRHHGLSDAIGFQYSQDPEPERAAATFVTAVKDLARGLRDTRDYVVSVILDGENAWSGYRHDGHPFLHALYRALAADREIKTVTMAEYIDGDEGRRVPPHPTAQHTRVYQLFTGSWIDEADSAPGVDLGTWVGEPEENRAWALLGTIRSMLEKAGRTPASSPEAFRALYAAEGSDWFWWFGSDHHTDAAEEFDDLFRGHLRAACRLAGLDPPPDLDRHIVPHRRVWTFTKPVDEIQAGDELIIRANCPGTLAWSSDAWKTVRQAPLSRVGGVMAGQAHHVTVLGPFSAGTELAFRFHCGHEGCSGEAPCCRGEAQAVKVER